VQGEIERVLATICGEQIRIHGAGRTDAGVHAIGQVIDFRTARDMEADELARGVNALLPMDIAVPELEPALEEFHARFSATGRTYEYRIRGGAVRDPLWVRREHLVEDSLDLGAMSAASRMLVGRHDFAAFTAGVTGEREVRAAGWTKDREVLLFRIEANAFLRGMVRGIVGTLLWVGRGKIGVDRFGEILREGDRSKGGPSAPAKGLCLMAVRYDGTTRGREDESENDE
jgi:tRNA pseudouridine38-40 synthase